MSESNPDFGVARPITAGSPQQTLRRAANLLETGGTVLLPEIGLELWASNGTLHCAVRDPQPLAHRCEIEYEVLVENARRALEASAFAAHLPPLPRRWFVVERHGDSVHNTLWTAP